MSWGIQAFGKATAVRVAVQKQFESGSKCTEPEETIRQAAAAIIDLALGDQATAQVLEVSASGSMYSKDGKVTSNGLNIAITPRWNFLE